LLIAASLLAVACGSGEKPEPVAEETAMISVPPDVAQAHSDNPRINLANPMRGRCPVTLDPVSYEDFATIDGQNWAFCSPECIEKFKADPQRYLDHIQDYLDRLREDRVFDSDEQDHDHDGHDHGQ
jgi:YHS domain-containing protein